jgi:hypothetical protein
MQNLLSDTVFPLLTVLLVMQSFRLRGVDRPRAFAYAVLVLFSSTLFNYANPVIKILLGEYDGTGLLMAGWERYPSILRTPNPQLSYFLVSLAAYGWLRWRTFWLLLLPLPVLYYFVAVPYVFLIAMGVALSLLRRKYGFPDWKAITVSVLAIYVLMALGAVGLFTIAGYYDPDNGVVNNAWVFAQTRMPQLPLVLLIILPIVVGLWRYRWLDSSRNQGRVLLVLMLASVVSVNLHVITGFMLSQKNYYDYGLSILFGLMLVAVLEWQKQRRLADGALILLLAITTIPTLASHLYFYQQATTISAKAAPIIDEVRRDSLHAIIPDLDVSSRMAYSTAQLLAPPFSYQYYFSFIEKQCRYYPDLLATGLTQARHDLAKRGDTLNRLEGTVVNIRRGQAESRTETYKNLSYCQPEAYRPHGFNLLTVAP